MLEICTGFTHNFTLDRIGFTRETGLVGKPGAKLSRASETISQTLSLVLIFSFVLFYVTDQEKAVYSVESFETDASTSKHHERKHIPSVSTALVVGGVLGLLQALLLVLCAKPVLSYMGVRYVSLFPFS